MGFVCTACSREVAQRGRFCPYCGTPAPPEQQPAPQRPLDAGDSLIGRKIANRYFVSRPIGRGGMGQVYRANDVALDRDVALKVLDRALLSDPTMVQRFQREARAASRLNHPNCITVLDVGQADDGTLFIAMEYLAGRPLSRLLAEEAPVEAERAVRIVAQILSALADAHASGIIHRDLKPSNVMVDARRDEPDFVKVLDFGLAKLSAAAGAPQLTGSGIVCGTPGYMSPEQARCEELDARSDLYAVGVILYELLSGRLPFDAGTSVGFAARRAGAPVSLRERRPDLAIAPALEALVERALAPDRADRPASAEAMRQELFACRGAGLDRPTPRPGRSSTVVLQAVRDGADRPVAGEHVPPKVFRFDAPAREPAQRPAADLGWSPPPAELRQPAQGELRHATTPLPIQPATPAARIAAPVRHPTTPLPRQASAPAPVRHPTTPLPRQAPAPAPQQEAAPAAPAAPAPRKAAAPPPAPEPTRVDEDEEAPAPRKASGARRAAQARRARRGLGLGAFIAIAGGGLAALALVVYLLAASDPFAAPTPAPGDEVRLDLGGAPGTRGLTPPRPTEPDPAGGTTLQTTKERR